MQQESIYLSQGNHQLHLRHIWSNDHGPAVVMFHGAIENGRIFYSEKGKGLACYLAQQGFNVFVADFRGRGNSRPKIKDDSRHGYYECIVNDIPAVLDYVADKTGQAIHVVCHSWGGVLFNSSLVRFEKVRKHVLSTVCFGTKRQVRVWNPERLLKVSLIWNRLAPLISRHKGYLDAEKLKIGADFETHESISQSVAWVKPSPWVDPVDGFNYEAAARKIQWPPVWHLTGINDKALGHAKDVELFIKETHNPSARFTKLSKKSGNLMDYDHINILTHPKTLGDHFPEVVSWLNQHNGV